MKKPTENISRAIVNLENDMSWQEIVEWIKDSLQYQSIKNNHLSGEDTIKGQGMALELEDLLKHIFKAREYLEKK